MKNIFDKLDLPLLIDLIGYSRYNQLPKMLEAAFKKILSSTQQPYKEWVCKVGMTADGTFYLSEVIYNTLGDITLKHVDVGIIEIKSDSLFSSKTVVTTDLTTSTFITIDDGVTTGALVSKIIIPDGSITDSSIEVNLFNIDILNNNMFPSNIALGGTTITIKVYN